VACGRRCRFVNAALQRTVRPAGPVGARDDRPVARGAGQEAAVDAPGARSADAVVRRCGLVARMPDGVELVADAWVPADAVPVGDRRYPVLLQRLPYGRSVASTPVLPHPSWFARRGYAVVVQDCRGCGDSGGVFEPFVAEAADGEATIAWAAALPFADGRVATYGFSYQGLAQLHAAARRPPALVAVAALMCAADPAEGWTYEGGCLRWPFVTSWAAQLAGLTTGLVPPVDPGALPAAAALGDDPPLWFVDGLAHPPDDPWWNARRADLAAIDVPVFTALGWFDDFSSGTAALIAATDAEAVCGPWSHMPWGTVHGGVDLGDACGPRYVADALAEFFDRVFAGSPAPADRVHWCSPGVPWRRSRTWPPEHRVERWTATLPAVMGARDAASSRHGTGVLVPIDLSVDDARADAGDAVVVVEPLVPHPGDPVDWQDERVAEERRDVLCYTTRPLEEPLLLAGSPRVTVVHRSDAPTHDVVATLVVVGSSGDARALTGTAQRFPPGHGEPDAWREDVLVLRPTAWLVPEGARLRLDLSGARFPAFDRNPHVDHVAPTGACRADTRVATLEVAAAWLDLPVAATTADGVP
jgi:uncharacterized protein